MTGAQVFNINDMQAVAQLRHNTMAYEQILVRLTVIEESLLNKSQN